MIVGASPDDMHDPAAAFDSAPCGLMVTNEEGRISLVNSTMCRWLGYGDDELVSLMRLQDLLTVGGRIFLQTHWQPLLRMQGSVAEVQLDVRCKDGRIVPMLMNAVRTQRGEIVAHQIAAFITEDRRKYERELVHERKRAEDLLLKNLQAQQFAEQMVGIVSHDLRNPLSVILMSANMLGRGEVTPLQSRTLARITSSIGRSQRLIADLLDFTVARVGQGLKLTLKTFDLHAATGECIEDLRHAYPARQLVHRMRGEGQGEVLADQDRLVQLIGNLVSNAVAYGSATDPITIESNVEADRAEVSVHNGGTPIPPNLLHTMFEPMTRGDLQSPDGRSVGLGLFIVSQIASAHGGKVTVASSRDEGTLFKMAFPRGADHGGTSAGTGPSSKGQ